MKSLLQARRQELLRELDRINRQIASVQKSQAHIESRIASLQLTRAKAA